MDQIYQQMLIDFQLTVCFPDILYKGFKHLRNKFVPKVEQEQKMIIDLDKQCNQKNKFFLKKIQIF